MADIVYERPRGRRKYISISKHMKNTNNSFSKWLNVNIERKVFDNADYGNFSNTGGGISWIDDNGNLWGLLQDYSDVGTAKQQFGYFQQPSNENGEWHGFPVVPFSQERYVISESLLMRWVNENVISHDDIPNILKKKRI